MRINIVIAFILAIGFLLISRVYYLSIKSSEYYKELSKKNYTKTIYYTANRGLILDRNGDFLAVNKIGFSIKIKPHLRKKKYFKSLQKTLHLISKCFPKYSYKKLLKKYRLLDSPYKHDYLTIIPYIAYNDFLKYFSILNQNEFLKIDSAIKRFYPYKSVAAHIIGYTGRVNRRDLIKNKNARFYQIFGRSGLEKYYNDLLNGSLGEKKVIVNAYNEIQKVLSDKKPIVKNLKTTIDIKLQSFINKLMKNKAGAVIVMKINGEILAAGSYPEFDNNIFVNGISQKKWLEIINDFNHPFTNKIVNGLYPPGSVVKMGVAISFLENKVSPYFKVYCTGALELGRRKFRCWKESGHGETGFIKAIRESCDDFFYKGSLKVGINKISSTLEKFGIGLRTKIDQPNESNGINPDKFWKMEKYGRPWYIGETLVSSIGQGFMLVTPIQIARYTASIATNKLPTPFLNLEKKTTLKNLNIKKRYLKIVQKGMYEVANHYKGTAYKYLHSFPYFKIAAKTGTAQVVGIPQNEKKRMKEYELEHFKRSHAWLTTYAPYKNPQIVVTVIIEHGGHGGSAAGGIVYKIYKKLYELGYIE